MSTKKNPKEGTKTTPRKDTRSKLDLPPAIEARGRELAKKRGISFQELLADVVSRELRTYGIDPWDLPGGYSVEAPQPPAQPAPPSLKKAT